MQAIVYHRYGSPDQLELAEVETPVADDDKVLVRVVAASVNAMDWHYLRGWPYFMRATAGLTRPKVQGLGSDLAGVVEAVGPRVTLVRPGDEVFGMSARTFAERARVSEQGLVLKPANLTFEAAAAIPVAAITALQGLRDKGRIRAGQDVLVNGAGGGVGSFAVQIAKSLGARVTGVTSAANVDLVRTLGADHVIDYEREDFTRLGRRYDLVFDAAGRPSLSDCRRAMAPDGVLVISGAPDGRWLAPILRPVNGALRSRLGSQTFAPFLAHRDHDDLLTLRDMAEAGTLRPEIDRTYPLRDVADAVRYVETGRARGKVVITI
jgi:NADPH:quinone reductase-like Zn-dependent oxidoreductase